MCSKALHISERLKNIGVKFTLLTEKPESIFKEQKGPNKRRRRFYSITVQEDRTALENAKDKVRELFGEFFKSNS